MCSAVSVVILIGAEPRAIRVVISGILNGAGDRFRTVLGNRKTFVKLRPLQTMRNQSSRDNQGLLTLSKPAILVRAIILLIVGTYVVIERESASDLEILDRRAD
jgi:hypothetical protein